MLEERARGERPELPVEVFRVGNAPLHAFSASDQDRSDSIRVEEQRLMRPLWAEERAREGSSGPRIKLLSQERRSKEEFLTEVEAYMGVAPQRWSACCCSDALSDV